MSSKSLIVPFGTDDNTDNMVNDNYLDIFGDICNKFIGFCYFNKVNVSLPYADFLNTLCVFLSTTFSTSQSIFENTFDIPMLTSYGISFGRATGGTKIKKGGMISGHDYQEAGVSTAVGETFGNLAKSFKESPSCWYVDI